MEMFEDLSIVIVDDMQFSRAVLRSALQRIGYTDIRLAGSASETLQMLDERTAEVVLADWVMPEMNGLELTDAIRHKDETSNHYTSIILFTGKEGGEAMLEAFRRGVDDYLTKPVADTELAARVYAAGRVSRLQNTLLETSSALKIANQYLEEISTNDPITRLPNRRFLDKQVEVLLAQTRNRGGGLCLALIDLDHFRDVNENYGHDVGDEVLIGFARRVERVIRPTDTLARLGGEEFALLMYYPDAQAYRPTVFDRVLHAISQRPIQTSEEAISVTASIGVVCYLGNAADAPPDGSRLFQQAEENLQRAKREGRNRVVGR